MRIALINLTSAGANAGAPWATCNSSLAVTNMPDTTGTATTWDFSFTAGNPSYNGFSGGTGYLGGAVGSGDAAWVNNQIVISTGVGVNKLSGWYSTKFAQLDTSKQYKLDIFGSINATSRNLEARVNGGASQSIPCYNNSTITMTFDNLQPNGSGELLLELRATDASSGYAYISAMRITELDSIVQDFSINEATVKPSDTISGTYAGWPAAPAATVTLTDSALNTLTLVASVTGGAGNGTWSATIPALPATGSDIELLKFGATTVSFGGFTAKAGPTLQVATTQTLATLASGFDDYVFQGWTPQPVAGDQLVTVTAEGVFNSNGDYTFYAEGVYPVWYVDGTGQVYGRSIDTSGLNQTDYLENLNLSSETISYKSLELVSGTGYVANLPLNSVSVSYKTLVENFGISYLQSLPLSSLTVTPKTLTLTAFGVGYFPDLPISSISVDSKQLQFVSFKNIPLDSKRIFYIK